jgi:D-alanyl-D-alanine carboxypeptidase (penicillin-binding protein 5/6)
MVSMQWFRWVFLGIGLGLSAKHLDVEVDASSALLMNGETGTILYEKNGFRSHYPASTTKIGTALFVLDKKKADLEQKLVVSPECLKKKPLNSSEPYPAYWWDIDGTRMWINVGEALPLETLLHGLMLVSGNDAANTIAEGLGGSIPDFMAEVNQYLKEEVGCKATKFLNPHGSHHPEHLSTAYDLCLMAKKALSIPKFREIVSKTSYTIPKTNKQKSRVLQQNNQLLLSNKPHYYPKAIGIKTGFHSHSKNNLIAAAEHEGRLLIAAILSTEDRGARYQDAIRLFEAAFQETKKTRRFLGPEHQFIHEVTGAQFPLKAYVPAEVLYSYYPAEESPYRAFVHWEIPPLPIQQGEKVGEVQILGEHDEILIKRDLIAKESLQETWLSKIKRFFSQF